MINTYSVTAAQMMSSLTDNQDKASCDKKSESTAIQCLGLPLENIDISSISKNDMAEINRIIEPFRGTTDDNKLSVISDLVRYAKEHPYASGFISAVGGFLTGYIVEKHLEATSLLDQIKNLEERKESLNEKKQVLKENIARKKFSLSPRVKERIKEHVGMDMMMGAAGGMAAGGFPVITAPIPVPLRLALMATAVAGGALFGLLFRLNIELRNNG